MIQVRADTVSLKMIEERLGSMRNKAPVLLKKSVNEVAKQTLKDVKSDVKRKYRLKSRFVSEEIYLKGKTSTRYPHISIIGKSVQHELMDFTVTPKNYNPERKKAVKGGQLKNEAVKELEGSEELKAFIIRFKNGHITAAQRQKRTSPNSQLGNRYVKKLMGSSMMIMLNEVWKEKMPYYSPRLRRSVEKHIEEIMGG